MSVIFEHSDYYEGSINEGYRYSRNDFIFNVNIKLTDVLGIENKPLFKDKIALAYDLMLKKCDFFLINKVEFSKTFRDIFRETTKLEKSKSITRKTTKTLHDIESFILKSLVESTNHTPVFENDLKELFNDIEFTLTDVSQTWNCIEYYTDSLGGFNERTDYESLKNLSARTGEDIKSEILNAICVYFIDILSAKQTTVFRKSMFKLTHRVTDKTPLEIATKLKEIRIGNFK